LDQHLDLVQARVLEDARKFGQALDPGPLLGRTGFASPRELYILGQDLDELPFEDRLRDAQITSQRSRRPTVRRVHAQTPRQHERFVRHGGLSVIMRYGSPSTAWKRHR